MEKSGLLLLGDIIDGGCGGAGGRKLAGTGGWGAVGGAGCHCIVGMGGGGDACSVSVANGGGVVVVVVVVVVVRGGLVRAGGWGVGFAADGQRCCGEFRVGTPASTVTVGLYAVKMGK